LGDQGTIFLPRLVGFTHADAILNTQTNYSQLYTTFWDRALGTMWAGDVETLKKRYDGVTEVDVGGKWVKWFGKNEGSGQKLRNGKPKIS
jgi:hypothetical protein